METAGSIAAGILAVIADGRIQDIIAIGENMKKPAIPAGFLFVRRLPPEQKLRFALSQPILAASSETQSGRRAVPPPGSRHRL